MKNKIIIFTIIFLLLSVFAQAAIESLIIKGITTTISTSSPGLGKIVQLAMGADPKNILVGEITKNFPEPLMKAYTSTQNPSEAILGDIQSKAFEILQQTTEGKKLANAVTKFKKYQGVLNEVTEDKRPVIEIKEDGKTYFIDPKTKRQLFTIGTNSAWELSTINKETGDFTLTRKQATNYASLCLQNKQINPSKCDPLVIGGAEVNLGNSGGKLNFKFDKSNGQSIIKLEEGSADVVIGNNQFKNIGKNPSAPAEIRTFTKPDGTTELQYASFTSTKDSDYTFLYGNKKYDFAVKQGGSLIFDPKNKKIEGSKNAVLNFEDKLIGSKDGSFTVNINEIGGITRIDYKANGFFLDNANVIQATSIQPFSVCFGSRTATDNNCKNSPNSLRIDYKENLNDIVSTGKIDYQVAFTKISGDIGSKTIFEQTPDYNYFFQVEKGRAVVKKDGLEAEVKYIPCSSACSSITTSAYEIYQTKCACGTIVNLKKGGIPTTITESINIVDKDKINGYTLGPKGGVLVKNFKTGKQLAGTFDPDESNIEIKSLWGTRFSSNELTSVVITNQLINGLENFKNDRLNPRWYDAFSSINLLEKTLPKKGDAILEMDDYISQLKSFKQNLELGYPIEEAAKNAGLPQAFVTTFSQSINYDGSVDIVQSAVSSEAMLLNAKNEKNRFVQLALYENANLFLENANQDIAKGRYGQIYNFDAKNNPNPRPSIANVLVDNYGIKNYDLPSIVNSLQSNINNAKKQGKKGITFGTVSEGSEGSFSYSLEEAEKELARLNGIYNAHKSEFNNLHETNKLLEESIFYRKTQDLGIELVTVADVIPIGTIMNLGSKTSLAIKEAGGIAKATRGAYKISSEFLEDVLKNPKAILALRPALIFERESAELIARRGTFENIPALARKYGCMSPCPFDSVGSEAEILFKKIDNNMEGASEMVEFFESRTPGIITADTTWQAASKKRLMRGTVDPRILSDAETGPFIGGLYRGRAYNDNAYLNYLHSGENSNLLQETGTGFSTALTNSNPAELAFYHQQTSAARKTIAASPFVSATTDPIAAARFSTGRATTSTTELRSAYVTELTVPESRVAMNPYANVEVEREALVGKKIESNWIKRVYYYDEQTKTYTLMAERGSDGAIRTLPPATPHLGAPVIKIDPLTGQNIADLSYHGNLGKKYKYSNGKFIEIR